MSMMRAAEDGQASAEQPSPLRRTWRRPSAAFIQEHELLAGPLDSRSDEFLPIMHWFEHAYHWIIGEEEKAVREEKDGALADNLADFHAWSAFLADPTRDAPQTREQAQSILRHAEIITRQARASSHHVHLLRQRLHALRRVASALANSDPSELPAPDLGQPLWMRRLFSLVSRVLGAYRDAEEARLGTRPATVAPLPDARVAHRKALPVLLPQYTFAEAKAVTIASADGPRGRRWTEVENETALRHMAADDAPLQVKFVPGPLAQWLDKPVTYATLLDELREMGLAANMTFHICVAALLERQEGTLIIDELITAIGFDPRSRAERADRRRQVWRWLVVFSCWHIIGQRKGKYRDPDTKQILDLRTETALFHIGESAYPMGTQLALDNSVPPVEVTLVRGPWLNRWAGNDRILSYFGNVRKLAAIPGGKPSGAWARAIAMSLFQLWRERATRTTIAVIGEKRHLTARSGPFTRRELLDLFPPEPPVDALLSGAHPRRAQEYWRDAITLLKKNGVIGYYQELGAVPIGRQGQAEHWLTQEIDIRPAHDETHDLAVMVERAEAGRKRRSRQTRLGN